VGFICAADTARSATANNYATVPWVGREADLSISYMFAARTMLRDWGLRHQIAGAGLGILSLMGFETNNVLHKDRPRHRAGREAGSICPGP